MAREADKQLASWDLAPFCLTLYCVAPSSVCGWLHAGSCEQESLKLGKSLEWGGPGHPEFTWTGSLPGSGGVRGPPLSLPFLQLEQAQTHLPGPLRRRGPELQQVAGSVPYRAVRGHVDTAVRAARGQQEATGGRPVFPYRPKELRPRVALSLTLFILLQRLPVAGPRTATGHLPSL